MKISARSILPRGGLLIFLLFGVTVPAAEKPQIILQRGLTARAAKIAFRPDGRLFAVMDVRGETISLWESSGGHGLRTLNVGPTQAEDRSAVSDFAFSRDGERILSVSSGNVKVWDVTTGILLAASRLLPENLNAEVVFSPDGRFLGTLAANRLAVDIWNLETGARILSLTARQPSGEMSGEQRAEEYRRTQHVPEYLLNQFQTVAFSPDGQLVATCERPYRMNESALVQRPMGLSTIRIWQIATGREQRSIVVQETAGTVIFSDGPKELAFSPSGRWLVLCVRGETSAQMPRLAPSILLKGGSAIAAKVLEQRQNVENRVQAWDVGSGRRVLQWSAGRETDLGSTIDNLRPRHALSFDGSGSVLAAAVSDTTVKWFEFPSGRESDSKTFSSGVESISLDPEGRVLAVGEATAAIVLNDLGTSRTLQVSGSSAVVPVLGLAFSGDGRSLISGADRMVNRWDLETGVNSRRIALPDSYGHPFFSKDGTILAARNNEGTSVKFWNITTGKEASTISVASSKRLESGALSPNAALIAIGEMTEQPVPEKAADPLGHPFGNFRAVINAQAILTMMAKAVGEPQMKEEIERAIGLLREANRRPIAQTAGECELKLFEVGTGRQVHTLGGCSSPLEFSPDGHLLAAAAGGKIDDIPRIALWDVDSGRARDFVPKLVGSNESFKDLKAVKLIAFSSDGRRLAAEYELEGTPLNFSLPRYPATVQVWEVASGNELGTISADLHGPITALSFSPDGKAIVMAGSDATITFFDLETRREIRTLSAQTGGVQQLSFSPDGKLLISATNDGNAELWSVPAGELLATLMSLHFGADWLAVTPDGLFDGSPAAWSQILWRFSESILDVAPVEAFFNEFYYPGLVAEIASGKRPKPVQEIAEKDRRQPHLRLSVPVVSAVSERTTLVHITVESAPAGAQDVRLFRNGSLVKVWHGDVLKGRGTVTLDATISVMAGENHLSAYAFNRDNVKSPDATFVVRGADALKRPGVAYVLAIGIDAYANPRFDLRYAAADAGAFAEEVKQQLRNLATYERVEVISLLNEQATRDRILSALQRLAAILQPEDAAIIYYAGHGAALQSRFYLIPHDLGYLGERTPDEAGKETIVQHGISDVDLENAFEPFDAAQVILVIDACNSGQALEAEEKRRGPMNSKGLAQLAYEKGMYILTAAQNYQAALEAASLGHGYLTYALVEEGLKQNAADFEPRDGVVLAREWLDFAAKRVPEMQSERRSSRILVQTSSSGHDPNAAPDANLWTAQQPRVFYRRELEDSPFIVARRKLD